MIFRGRQLSGVTEQDLQKLVHDEVQERDTIEYKGNMYGHSDDDKREMLKDISSMANHRGGDLIIGMEEDEEGFATKVVGIEAGNHVERITNSCLDNIDKRIVGLAVEDVLLSNGKIAVIVSIPESMNAPHMVIFKGLNQFWKRHGRQKDKVTIDEIGDAFEKRASSLNRLDRFLFIRKAEILERIANKTYMVISTFPAYLREEVIFDIHDDNLRTMMSSPPRSTGSFRGIFCGQPYVTLTGLKADNSTPYWTDSREPSDYLEIFRNGYIEYGKLIERRGEELFFASTAHARYIVDFVLFVEKVYGIYLPLTPLVVSFAIYNARDMCLAVGRERFDGDYSRVKWQQHLELEKFYIENLNAEAKLLPKKINDRIWQAFYRERSFVFDEEGNLLQR